jgi:hypothetical protein
LTLTISTKIWAEPSKGCKSDNEDAVAIIITPRELLADEDEAEEKMDRNISVRCLDRKESACYKSKLVCLIGDV